MYTILDAKIQRIYLASPTLSIPKAARSGVGELRYAQKNRLSGVFWSKPLFLRK